MNKTASSATGISSQLQEQQRQAAMAWLEGVSPEAWAIRNLRTDRGGALHFPARPYLTDILADESPCHVCVACAQSGKTLTYLAKTFHRLLHPRAEGFIPTAIYTFPTHSDVLEFSKARAKRMIQSSPLLSEEIADLDAAEVKQGRSGWTIYFRGTFTQRAALSVPAGMLVHDELDRSRPDTLQMYSDRMRDSADPHRFLFSTPTLPGFGISAEWERSTQNEWVWSCAQCRHEQVFAPMDKSIHWSAHLDLEGRVFRCAACGAPVPHETVVAGRWEPWNAGASASGYHISGIMPPRADAATLAEEHEKALFPELFVQGHIGLPEVSGDKQLTPDMITFGDWPNTLRSDHDLYAGLDQGRKLDVVVGDGMGRILAVHRFDDWAQVASLMRTMRVKLLVCDGQPDPRPVQELVAQFPGRVLLADYTLNVVEREPYDRVKTEPRVRLHRTAMLDLSRDRIVMGADGGDVWPALPAQAEAVLKSHLCSPQRTTEKDTHGVMRGAWVETGPDHLRHAHVYYVAASLMLANRGGRVAAISLEADPVLVHPELGGTITDELGRPVNLADLEAKLRQHSAAGDSEWDPVQWARSLG